MEQNASSSNPENATPPSEPATFNKIKNKKGIKWPFILLGILVVLLGVALSYYVFSLKNRGSNNESQTTEEIALYQNSNGFEFSYPQNSEIREEDNGVVVMGDNEVAFVVESLEGQSLLQTVNTIAENFNLEVTDEPETITLNSRTGYKLMYQETKYYYFPLFNNNYLEIVDENPGEEQSELVSSLKFTAPQAQVN